MSKEPAVEGPSAAALYWPEPVPYGTALRFQEALHAARVNGRIGDTVLFLQHPPVITLGNRGRDQHLLASRVQLQELGVEVVHASRGGDVTYHAPGQLVLYPILHLGSQREDAHGYLHNLETTALCTAAEFGVEAFRRDGKSGAWTRDGKLAAIGFRLKRWVSMHGMSFNVDLDLSGFDLIVPCGLAGEPVTSLQALKGDACPSFNEVRLAMGRHFEAVCGRRLAWIETVPAEQPEALVERVSLL